MHHACYDGVWFYVTLDAYHAHMLACRAEYL